MDGKNSETSGLIGIIEMACKMLAATPERWRSLAESTPLALMTGRPLLAEWSPIECLQHIIDSERVYQFRIGRFLAGQDFPGFNPDKEGTPPGERTPLELAEDFENLRRESLVMLAKLGGPDLERSARHQELGPVTLGEMLNAWVAHDLNHTMQAERALIQPFMQRCGPWIRYFTAHVFEG
jgi:hypothetical protein